MCAGFPALEESPLEQRGTSDAAVPGADGSGKSNFMRLFVHISLWQNKGVNVLVFVDSSFPMPFQPALLRLQTMMTTLNTGLILEQQSRPPSSGSHTQLHIHDTHTHTHTIASNLHVLFFVLSFLQVSRWHAVLGYLCSLFPSFLHA